jgi:prolyl oligopeptidase
MNPFVYPEARKDAAVSDNFHGVDVKDPYRWLEDPDADETVQFVEAQNKLSEPFLKAGDEWQKLNTKLTKFWNYPKYSCPFKHGNRYFFFKNTGLQNQE